MTISKDHMQGLIKVDDGWHVAPVHDAKGQRLAKLRSYELLDTPPEAAFDRISALAAALLATPIALVNLIDTHRQWFKSCYGMATMRETPLDHAFCTHALCSEQRVTVVEDASRDERFYNSPLVTEWPHVRFYAGAPLVTGDGHKIGSLCVIDRVARSDLGDDQKDHLASLADIAMDQIELSLANRKAGRRIEHLQKSADPHMPGNFVHLAADQERASTGAGAPNLLLAGVDESVIALLRACGCHYEHCNDPAGMVDIMAEHGARFDAVMLGCHDRGDSACNLVRRLRTMKDRCFRKLPVIGLTARMDSESFELCMQSGMNDMLQTPLTLERLSNCLREYLGTRMANITAGGVQP